MITRIRIQNYRSFVDAEVGLRPFSLVVGANGSGKSNLLKFLAKLEQAHGFDVQRFLAQELFLNCGTEWSKHANLAKGASSFEVMMRDGKGADFVVIATENEPGNFKLSWPFPWQPNTSIPHFVPDANRISQTESIIEGPYVHSDGSGTAQVLESLKNGDREDLFDRIEGAFRRYVPEVEKLSLRTVEEGKKQIQVREKGLKELLPATELSEGTRIILCLLTILHQEKPPPIILLEDIDRGLHPRLFEYMVPIMRDIAERHGINILATTHNPYLVDCFKDNKEAVIIVEKKDGASTLTTLADKLKNGGIDYDSVDPDDMPLGNLWFSGHVGGVPPRINLRAKA